MPITNALNMLPIITRLQAVEGRGLPILAIARPSLLAYWPLHEPTGRAAFDMSGNGNIGTYQASGVTLGQPGLGDGNAMASFAAGSVNVLPLSAFNGNAWTLVAIGKVAAAANWTDGVTKTLLNWVVDTENSIQLRKPAGGSQLQALYEAGNVLVSPAVTTTTTDWFTFGVTCAGGELKLYMNGELKVTTTGLGVWTGSLATALIGAGTINGVNGWAGQLSVAAWSAALTANQIAGVHSAIIDFAPIGDAVFLPGDTAPTIVKVRASGGDFTTPDAMLAGITDASTTNRYRAVLADEDWTVVGTASNGLYMKDFIDIHGAGQERTILRSNGAVSGYVIARPANCEIRDLTLIGEIGAKDTMHIDHVGFYTNDGFRCYGLKLLMRVSRSVIGCGITPGAKVAFYGCELMGHVGIHGDNFDRTGEPALFEFYGCQMRRMVIQDFLEYTKHIVRLGGCDIAEYITVEYDKQYYTANPADVKFNRGYLSESILLLDEGNRIGWVQRTGGSAGGEAVRLMTPVLPSFNGLALNKGAGAIALGEAVKQIAAPFYAPDATVGPANMEFNNIAKWDGTGIFVGFAQDAIGVYDAADIDIHTKVTSGYGTVAHRGTPRALADATVAIAYGDELELNSSGRVVKRTTGRLVAHALAAKASGVGIIVVRLAV